MEDALRAFATIIIFCLIAAEDIVVSQIRKHRDWQQPSNTNELWSEIQIPLIVLVGLTGALFAIKLAE